MTHTSKFKIMLALVSLIFCIMFIQETYAKYVTSTDGVATMSIARWRILVNNEDIRDNASLSSSITPTFSGTDNISADVIAPLAEGYFDLVIDATETDVSFSYTISTNASETSAVSDFIATGYSLDDGEIVSFTEEMPNITGTIANTSTNKVISVRIYVTWDDGETAQMNNQADTEATYSNDPNAKMDVTISVIQEPDLVT